MPLGTVVNSLGHKETNVLMPNLEANAFQISAQPLEVFVMVSVILREANH